MFADAAAFAFADVAGEVHLYAGFGKGKEVGAETDLGVFAQNFVGEVGEVAFEVGHRNIFRHIQAFHLMEIGGVGRIGGVTAVGASGGDDAHGRGMAEHVPDLNRRGLGAQQRAVGQVKGVLLIAGGMIGRRVQGVEIMKNRVHIRSGGDVEADAVKNIDHPHHDLTDGMVGALWALITGEGHVERIGGGTQAQQGFFACLKKFGHLHFEIICPFAKGRTLFRGDIFQPGHNFRELAFTSEILDAHIFQRFRTFSRVEFRQGLPGEGLQIFEIHNWAGYSVPKPTGKGEISIFIQLLLAIGMTKCYQNPMAKLINVFSWSHSAAGDFEQCRRKRYWSKYGAWGGWEADASSECKTAYRLNKMTNRFCLYGVATEDAVMWMLRAFQQGRTVTVEEAFDAVARPQLRKAWDESTGKVWQRFAKAACLHEHYYPQFCDLKDMEIMRQIADVVKTCLKNFQESVLPRLAEIRPEMEIQVGVVGKGDAEHFLFEGVKVYAIPDYVYVQEGVWHIIDWKSGSPKPEHLEQLALYALWASVKHGIAADKIQLRLEYLQHGTHESFSVSEEELEVVKARILESVQDMAQYLEEGDFAKNIALPKVEWDMCYEAGICHQCSFFELCRRELKEALGDEIEKSLWDS